MEFLQAFYGAEWEQIERYSVAYYELHEWIINYLEPVTPFLSYVDRTWSLERMLDVYTSSQFDKLMRQVRRGCKRLRDVLSRNHGLSRRFYGGIHEHVGNWLRKSGNPSRDRVFYRYITPEMELRYQEVFSSHQDVIRYIERRSAVMAVASRLPQDAIREICSFL